MKQDNLESKLKAIINQMMSESPKFHGRQGDLSWHINKDVLNWLAANACAGMTTLETGAGYSTVIFAMCGARHTAISPASWEHERILRWCQEHGIATDELTFIDDYSESVLPNLETDPLDIVLIDGRHAFPSPFIDWYYAASRLKVGGRVIVDDTFLRSCKILNEFLLAEKGRWQCEAKFAFSSIFKKISEDIHSPGWRLQPWGEKKLFTLKTRAIMFKNAAKNRLYRLLGLRK